MRRSLKRSRTSARLTRTTGRRTWSTVRVVVARTLGRAPTTRPSSSVRPMLEGSSTGLPPTSTDQRRSAPAVTDTTIVPFGEATVSGFAAACWALALPADHSRAARLSPVAIPCRVDRIAPPRRRSGGTRLSYAKRQGPATTRRPHVAGHPARSRQRVSGRHVAGGTAMRRRRPGVGRAPVRQTSQSLAPSGSARDLAAAVATPATPPRPAADRRPESGMPAQRT